MRTMVLVCVLASITFSQDIKLPIKQVQVVDTVLLCDGVPVKTRIVGCALFSTIFPIMVAIVAASIHGSHR